MSKDKTRDSELIAIMPEIIELRKEFKKKNGNTRVFDHFYMGLRDTTREKVEQAILSGDTSDE